MIKRALISAVLVPLSIACTSVEPTADHAPTLDTQAKSDGLGELIVDNVVYERISAIRRLSFTDVALSGPRGSSASLGFVVPNDTVGFSIIVHGGVDGAYSYVYRLTDPWGTELISPDPVGVPDEKLDLASRGQVVSPNGMQLEVFPQASITPVPINPRVEIVPGEWSLEVAREGPADGSAPEPALRDVEIIIKTVEGSTLDGDTLGVLPIAIHVSRASALSIASGAPIEQRLEPAIDLYQRAGILLQFPAVAELDAVYDEAQAFDYSLGGRPNDTFMELMTEFGHFLGVGNAFFIKASNYNTYAGISSFSGSTMSFSAQAPAFGGLLVADDRSPAQTFAHELGHYLGLYHTNVDQLRDTYAFDHVFNGDEYVENGLSFADGANLMDEGGASQLILSEEQVWVMRRAPAVTLYQPAP